VNVRVEPNRFLSVACEPDERIVFDRKETKYHLLRDSAARLWDDICEGGTFEVAAGPDGNEPLTLLAEAGLIGIDEEAASEGITRRVWLRRTGKVSAAAVVLPLVASITTPRLVLGQIPSVEELDAPTGNEPTGTEPTGTQETDTTPLSESPVEKKGRTPKDERNQLKEETGNSGGGVGNTGTPPASTGGTENNGTRTRTRTRTGHSSTPETESGTRTRTRPRDR
jgi:hypothetical protein